MLPEWIVQFFVLPITMYTGFGRLVVLHEIKTKFLYICMG
jgi:hypothetical protein